MVCLERLAHGETVGNASEEELKSTVKHSFTCRSRCILGLVSVQGSRWQGTLTTGLLGMQGQREGVLLRVLLRTITTRVSFISSLFTFLFEIEIDLNSVTPGGLYLRQLPRDIVLGT